MKKSAIKWLLNGLIFLNAFVGMLVAQGIFPEGFRSELILRDLNPVTITIDHHGRVWVVEKHGVVSIIDEEGIPNPDPFIHVEVDDFNEKGLLGIALHPDFDRQPYVYLYYSVKNANYNRVSRFLARGDLAEPGSEEILLELDDLSGPLHNGGAMKFGPDGYLYIGTGDGTDPTNAGNLNSLLGKILRIADDGTIPSDNPFHGTLTGKYLSIWAYGLRNPFSFDIDPANGRLFACDVGLGDFEEINEIVPGADYGWPQLEGFWQGSGQPENYQDPFYAYEHQGLQACAIVGAAFYRPFRTLFPSDFDEQFFFADYCNGSIQYIDPDTKEVGIFATGVVRPLNFIIDLEGGQFYFLSREGLGGGTPEDNTSTAQGSLWKVSYSGKGEPFFSTHPVDQQVATGEDAVFSINALGDDLRYAWIKDGVVIPNAGSAVLELSEVSTADDSSSIQCVITNSLASDTSRVANLFVSEYERPQVSIEFPLANGKFSAGDTIYYQGNASQDPFGIIADEQLCWSVDLHHDLHRHPAIPKACGINRGSFVIPLATESDTNIWYRINLTATGTDGLVSQTSVDILPDMTDIEISGPQGLTINVDGQLVALPTQIRSLRNLRRIVEVPHVQVVGDSIYLFKAWHDGSTDRLRTLYAREPFLNSSILFEATPIGSGDGLTSEIFMGEELDLDSLVEVRIDSVINFAWGNSGPLNAREDFFSVRWEGQIQPIFSEEYTFFTSSDDGVRLWINDQLIIDQWIPQGVTEHSGTVALEAGKKYPIRLEYFERDGGAEVRLKWSSPLIDKQIIPQQQLYSVSAEILGTAWLDHDCNGSWELHEEALEDLGVSLHEWETQNMIAFTEVDSAGKWSFPRLASGSYYLKFGSSDWQSQLISCGDVDFLGLSTKIDLDRTTSISWDAPFALTKNISFGFESVMTYPNPCLNELNLSVLANAVDRWQIVIFSVQGQVVFEETFSVLQGKRDYVLPVAGLDAGIYYLQIANGSQIIGRKFVKM